MLGVLGAALIAGLLLLAPQASAHERGLIAAHAEADAGEVRARLWRLAPQVQLAAVYRSAPDAAGGPGAAFDFDQGARTEPRISIDHVEAFLPHACDGEDGARDPGCRATGSVFCSAAEEPETFISSALMVRVRQGESARCYLVSTRHSLERPDELGAASVVSEDGRGACRFVRDHDMAQSPAGPARAWAALAARARGSRARTRWDFRGMTLPRSGGAHIALPARIAGANYVANAEDDYARLLVSEGAACLAEDAIDYAPAAPVQDPAACESVQWVGSFLGVRRYARFEGGDAARRIFRFGAEDFGYGARRRFAEHRMPSWEGVSGFAALCRRGSLATPLCIHAKGDAITRFQRDELGRSRRIVVGDDEATGNGCVAMTRIFGD